MPTAKPLSVKEYLDSLPAERRKALDTVRKVVKKHLPQGYRETLHSGMVAYVIPLDVYPRTYNRQPLMYAALAAQKNYNALYVMGPYMDPAVDRELKGAFARAGKKLDMGKSCIRFREVEDLPLDAIGKVVGAMPVERFISLYEKSRGGK